MKYVRKQWLILDRFDLKKFNIDELGEPVKPVKGIRSLITRDYGNFHLDIEVGELILLMEDGSFRKVED